jgi:GTP pyrophosphokinase
MVTSDTPSITAAASWQARVSATPALADPVRACAAYLPGMAECADVLDRLALLGCDAQTQASAVWFELARRDPAVWAEHAKVLAPELQRLVEGQFAAQKVWALHAQREAGSAEGLRRLLLAIIRDLRVVFVLLARQLARMRAAAELPEAERLALARLTRDIHAPLANRLGIWQLKWELEDLAFRHLQPDTYKRIAHLLDERRADREAYIAQVLAELGAALRAAGIEADLAGRPKHIYSIWKKMQRKGLEFSDLYDIRAVRILVDSVAECYAALGVVHAQWQHLPREFDDYLARPKGNGYRSLHTAVIGPQGKTLEVQIRTHAMHRDNELGVAAHWRYKEGGGADAEFEAKIAWRSSLRRTPSPAATGSRRTTAT